MPTIVIAIYKFHPVFRQSRPYKVCVFVNRQQVAEHGFMATHAAALETAAAEFRSRGSEKDSHIYIEDYSDLRPASERLATMPDFAYVTGHDYHPRCNQCWLNHSHTFAEHRRNLS